MSVTEGRRLRAGQYALKCDRCGCRYLETPETAAEWGYYRGAVCRDLSSGGHRRPCGGTLLDDAPPDVRRDLAAQARARRPV